MSKLNDLAEKAKAAAKAASDAVGDVAHAAIDKAGELASQTKERVGEAAEHVADALKKKDD